MHADAPMAALPYFPAAQVEQLVAPAVYVAVPALQATQSKAFDEPTISLKVPTGQSMHAEAPITALPYLPAVQTVQFVASAL